MNSIDRLLSLIPEQPSDEALAVMLLSVVDWMSCGLAGQGEPVAQATMRMILDEGGAATATLFGGAMAPCRGAALVNGATSHALDYDDTHFAHIGHPSVAVLPAAMAIGEREGASLEQVIGAALKGCELSVRLGLRLGRAHYQVGYHQTATAGAFGAAYAASLLLSPDPTAHAVALNIVSTRASGLKSQFGTMGKPYNAGIAAMNGVEATLLAPHFTAPDDALSGTNGFFETHHADGIWDQPKGWLMTGVSHKYHACCHGLHAALEAFSVVRPNDPDQVTKITVRTNPRWMSVCNIATPRTGLEAKFSYRQVLAMALHGVSTAKLESYSDTICTRPDIVAARQMVDVIADPQVSETASVVSVTTGGAAREQRFDLATPQAYPERAAKLRDKAASLVGVGPAERIWDVVHDASSGAVDLSALMQG